MRTRIKIKVENYDITADTGYKTGLDGTIDDAACKNAFDQNAYNSLPAPDSNDPMVAADQSSMFTKISYASIDEAKTALLSNTINTAISTYVDGTPTYSLNSGDLTIECYFTNADNLKSWSQAVSIIGAWNSAGAVVSHV